MKTWQPQWHHRKSISIIFKGGMLRKSVTLKGVQAVGFCVSIASYRMLKRSLHGGRTPLALVRPTL